MLVLNRRPGESILVEGGVVVSVLQATHQTVWTRIEGERISPSVLLGATAVSPEELRLEVGAPAGAWIDEDGVRIELAGEDHLSVARRAAVSFLCRPGQVVRVGEGLELGVGPTERGHPCLVLRGPAVGAPFRLALIRLTKSCVRLGVDAPGLRVYRMELWEALVASNTAAAEGADDLSGLAAAAPHAPAPSVPSVPVSPVPGAGEPLPAAS